MSGAAVAGATVAITSAGVTVTVQTDADGTFAADVAAAGTILVTASAPGFDDAVVAFEVGDSPLPLVRIVLHPATFAESVSVTASRGAVQLGSPASVSVVTSAQLANSPFGAVDDALRVTPGFSLFRRSSSRVANPTTQGVTLRGVSGSGASRTLVLADGTPLNDPFGSWVYWNRVPLAAIDRIEVVRGASGDLYGTEALGGVIQVLSHPGGQSRLRAVLDGGSHETIRGSVFAGVRASAWTFGGAGEWQQTTGVPIVAEDERGPVDVPAYSRYRTGFAALEFADEGWRADLRASAQAEHRGNGTPIQINDTTWWQASGSVAGPAGGGLWRARVSGGSQDFFQTFSAINASRTTERQTSEQTIPTSFANWSAQWARQLGRHALVVGGEGRHTDATVNETRYSLAGLPLDPTVTGGSETSTAVFSRVSVVPGSSVSIDAGLRADIWRTEPREAETTARSLAAVSPRVSFAWRPDSTWAAHAAVYQAYRTPTLNELFRGFRVGNILTNPNPLLDPEHLTGIEGGLLFTRGATAARATGFYNRLTDAVTNVTISTTPALVLRERQNTDTVRAAGVELELDVRPVPSLSVTGTAVLTASHFVESPAQPDIEGNRVPQVPAWQLGASLTWTDTRVATIVTHVRAWGMQYDDDQNQLELRSYATVDLSATRSLARGLHLFVAVENLFDVEYDVGRTPVRTVGWPRSLRVGVRYALR